MAFFDLLRDRLSKLPVYPLIDVVVRDVIAGHVTIVAASTGSGKSMILPSALADVSDHQIIVLTPRRFLAMDAAFNVAELSDIPVGDKVGYALGNMDGESSQYSKETRVLYCTYGYALRSGLINKAQTIVLDEVHEADELISLARAILYQRKKHTPEVRILEMSATVDAHSQALYWQDIAQTSAHIVEGKALDCDVRHESLMQTDRNDRIAEDIVIELLSQGRKGIVLFRPGVREVEESVVLLKDLLAGQKRNDVDVVGIHGGTPADQRSLARRAPDLGRCKIIVGTNVIESGVNLRWLDAGVSDGLRKIPYSRDDTGAEALVLEDLPQAGLLQQIGRINRDPLSTGFDRGLFILHAKKPFERRRLQNGPALQRQNLSGISFYAASLGYNPTELNWDVVIAVHRAVLPARFEQAKRELIRLNLIHSDWHLTEEGEFIKHLPVSPETGALLLEAKHLDEERMRQRKSPRVMRDAVVMAALTESHGLRKDTRVGHKGDQHHTSDVLDGLNAFRALRQEPLAQNILDATEAYLASATEDMIVKLQEDRTALENLALKHNISLTSFVEVARLADEITHRLSQRDKGIRVDTRRGDDAYDAQRYGELQRCLLNAHVNRLFIYENDGVRDLLRDYKKNRNNLGYAFNGYVIGRGSIISKPKSGVLLVGSLREVQTDTIAPMSPLIVLTDVTVIPPGVFVDWAVARANLNQPVLTNVRIEDNLLSGSYFDRAVFDVPVSGNLLTKASYLIM